jgi:hypothetical protein
MLAGMIKFIYYGYVPEMGNIEISIDGIDGDYHKIYRQGGVYILEKN